MRPILTSVCASCAIVAILAAWGWQRWLDTEISAAEYGALYSLRRMDPALFKDKLLPELEKALADGRLTHGEMRAINSQVGAFGKTALEAFKKTSVDEQLGETLEEAQRKGAEAGRNLGDTLGKALDDLSGFIQRKAEELTNPKEEPQAPSTF